MNFKKTTKIKDLLDFCGPLGTEIHGDENLEVSFFGTPDCQVENSLAFINNPKLIDTLENSKVVAAIAPVKMKEVLTSQSKKTFLFSPNPDLAAREIKKQFVLNTPYKAPSSGIHKTAVIDESAELASDVSVGPYAVIGKNVKIASGSFVGSNAVIEENVSIGSNTTIHPLAYVGHSCEIGNDCEIKPHAVIGSEGFGYAHDHLGNHYRIPHSGKVILENDVHIGAGSAIDRGTIEDSVIKQGCKIDNHVHLAHNTVLGKNGIITAQVVTAGSTTIGDNFICGGKTAITGHITVADNVNVAGFSGVSKSVDKPGQYGGYPLQPLKQHLKTKASSVHIPEMRKQLNKVLKKLFPEDYN